MTVDPGDIGRRVRARRESLHLSIADLAHQARVDPRFLGYVEDQAAVSIDPATLFRLAEALGTTAQGLLGGGIDRAPGHSAAQPNAHLSPLEADECRRLVGRRGIGRVVFEQSRGPVALPVNYVVHGADIVFRTTHHSALTEAIGQPTGFEVDRIDDELSQGWSVLYTGDASEVTDPAELELLAAFPPQPWADGERDIFIRIVPTAMTGRRLGPAIDAPNRDETESG
ncbi:MAG: family transcriptional regulator [Acidimicrobiia bacterium]|nr:family transcriptional regulator [Acidimicrobiia bacterium]